ncbi:MAG: zf-HC2 domain-containing protein [Gaiellaceae bacterium]
MRLLRPFFDACDTAREQLSLQLDRELPELDRARLDAHLEQCAACRSFGAEIGTLTTTLRQRQLEEARFTISIPRRRHVSVRTLQAGAAAAAVALVAGLSAVSGLTSRQAAGTPLKLGPYVSDRGDELIPGKVHFRIKPQRNGDRIAL